MSGGHTVVFATPEGEASVADELMVSGRADGRRAYAALRGYAGFKAPLRWNIAQEQQFDGLLLPGGHRARGMRAYLESSVLRQLVVELFAREKPLAAICHGVLLAARSMGRRPARALLGPELLPDLPGGSEPDYGRKTNGRARDAATDARAAWVVRDRNYISARWPGDVHTFARALSDIL